MHKCTSPAYCDDDVLLTARHTLCDLSLLHVDCNKYIAWGTNEFLMCFHCTCPPPHIYIVHSFPWHITYTIPTGIIFGSPTQHWFIIMLAPTLNRHAIRADWHCARKNNKNSIAVTEAVVRYSFISSCLSCIRDWGAYLCVWVLHGGSRTTFQSLWK